MEFQRSTVTTELEAVLGGRSLARSPRLRALLRHLVEAKLEGRTGELRETVIALDVFGRDAAVYDPNVDPIVRVSAGRLREALEKHYAADGSEARLRFELQRGSYIPIIRRATPAGLPASPRIAVLPLANFTGSPGFEALCDGLTEDIIDALAQLPHMSVIARTSSFRYKGQTPDIRAVSRELDVDAVLEGSVQRVEDELRVTAQLIVGTDGTHLWSHAFVGPASDRARLLSALIEVMLRSLGRMSVRADAVLARRDSETVPRLVSDMIDQVRANVITLNRESLERAEALALELARIAPTHAPAQFALAWVRFAQRMNWDWNRPVAVEDIAEPLARARRLDPENAMALIADALFQFIYARDHAAALELARQAFEIAPSQGIVVMRYGILLLLTGAVDRGDAMLAQATELDPYMPLTHYWYSFVGSTQRDFDLVHQRLDAGLARTGNALTLVDGELACMLNERRFDEVLTRSRELILRYPAAPTFALRIAQALAGLGKSDEARAAFAPWADKGNPHHRAYLRMVIEATAGNADEFFGLAAESDRERCPNLWIFPVDPAFRRFRSDPRWAPFVESLGFRGVES